MEERQDQSQLEDSGNRDTHCVKQKQLSLSIPSARPGSASLPSCYPPSKELWKSSTQTYSPQPPRRETGENNPYFFLIQQLQGLKTLLNSPSKGKVKQLSKPPKEIQELRTAGGPLPQLCQNSLARGELMGNQLWMMVQTPKFSPSHQRNCKSQGSI